MHFLGNRCQEVAPVTTTSMPPDVTDIDMPTSDGDNNTGTDTTTNSLQTLQIIIIIYMHTSRFILREIFR